MWPSLGGGSYVVPRSHQASVGHRGRIVGVILRRHVPRDRVIGSETHGRVEARDTNNLEGCRGSLVGSLSPAGSSEGLPCVWPRDFHCAVVPVWFRAAAK